MNNNFKILNLEVRAKNVHFWLQIAMTMLVTMLTYAGLTGSEITTWKKLADLIVATFSNPYCLFMVAVSVYNALVDPTTKGFKDSEQALTYKRPKEEN